MPNTFFNSFNYNGSGDINRAASTIRISFLGFNSTMNKKSGKCLNRVMPFIYCLFAHKLSQDLYLISHLYMFITSFPLLSIDADPLSFITS